MTTIPRAFLCSQDGLHNFPITQRITTIGKENCDIIVNTTNVDSQHALIEYLEDENCFILQDLNSSSGTYINDCRIQNTTVRLVEQDTIKFGFNGIPFQFIVQSQFMTIPPINLIGSHRQSGQQLQIINQTVPSRGRQSGQSGTSFWVNSSQIPNASLITINNQSQQCPTGSATSSQKPPASLRSRPISANTNARFSKDSPSQKNSWVKGFTNSVASINTGNNPDTPIDSETYRREDNDIEVSTRVAQLERELKIKALEIRDLREKVAFYQTQANLGSGPSAELEQIKRDKSIAVGLVNTMQKDLSNKDSTISKLAREIEGHKREMKDKDNTIKELEDKLRLATDDKKSEEEIQKKDKELIVLRSKFKTTENKIIDLTNQVLQIKNELEESQRQSQKYTQVEKALKDELEHSKSQFLDMQRAERTVRIDLEQMKRNFDKFRNLIIQSIYSTPGVVQPSDGDVTDDFLVNEWKKIINERTGLVDNISSLKKKLSGSEQENTDMITNLTNFELHLSQIEQKLSSSGRRTAQIDSELKALKELEVDEKIEKLRDLVVGVYKNEHKWQNEIEDTLKKSFNVDLNNNDSVRSILLKVHDRLEVLNKEKLDCEAKIKNLEDTNSKLLSDELEKRSLELSTKLTDLESELNAKHLKQIEDLKREHEEFLVLARNDFTVQLNQITEEKTKLVVNLESLNSELTMLKQELDIAKAQDELHDIKKRLFNAETELKQKEEFYLQQIEEKNVKLAEAESSYLQELSAHKEQIKQHSITIVNFEKEITLLREKEVDYLTKIENFEKRIRELSFKKSVSPPPKAPSPVQKETSSVEITALNRTIELLKMESQTYKSRITDQEELIKTLRRDLSGASAKLSDIQGDMTEKHKRELERNKQLVIEQQRELSDNRAHMAKLSEIVDRQTKQLDALKVELTKAKSHVEKYRHTSEENGRLAVELKSKLEEVEAQLKKFDNIKKEEGKITNELTAVGAQCKGERHEQVIQRQREALNELRQRLKVIEQTRPAVPNQQQQMQQQIMLLKKQLAEVRASQALTEDIAKQANLARGNDQAFLMLEEKTAHFETQTALESSEESYLTLLKTISTILDITELDGLRSMSNLPPDERKRLLFERAKSAEFICCKVKALLEKLERKDEILKEYELDLAKLRQAEFLLQKKSDQLDEIQMYSRSREDEIEYLKESLKNTKSDLEREKLLNSAIKQKKPLSTVQQMSERVRRESTDKLHHHCPPEDQRSNQTKKTMNDKIKRKDYELQTLKDELKVKSEEISNLTTRLTIVENGGQLK